jgi:glucosylceramidase
MIAAAAPPGPTDPCCTGDVAAGTVDDDATTRWASGVPQAPGQYVQVDLGRRARIARVVLDTGPAMGDFPRGYALHLSQDGTSWGDPVATGAGSGQLTAIDFEPRRARHIRIVSTAAADAWWSIADLRVYRP